MVVHSNLRVDLLCQFSGIFSVLGAENNTKSWLEVSGSSEPLQALQTPNIVTEDVPHKIKIEIPEGNTRLFITILTPLPTQACITLQVA